MTSVKVTSIKTQPDTPRFVAFLRNPEALLFHYLIEQGASLVAQTVNNVLTMQEIWVQFLGQEDPLEKGMATTPVFLPGESMDRGAWWAAVHWVAKSQTRLSY